MRGIDAPGRAGDGVPFALVAEAASALIEGLIAEVAGQPLDRFSRHQDARLTGRCERDKNHRGDRGVLPGVGPWRVSPAAQRILRSQDDLDDSFQCHLDLLVVPGVAGHSPEFGHRDGEQADFIHLHTHGTCWGVLGSLEQIVLRAFQRLAVRTETRKVALDHECHQPEAGAGDRVARSAIFRILGRP